MPAAAAGATRGQPSPTLTQQFPLNPTGAPTTTASTPAPAPPSPPPPTSSPSPTTQSASASRNPQTRSGFSLSWLLLLLPLLAFCALIGAFMSNRSGNP